jgi:hypothetical protein
MTHAPHPAAGASALQTLELLRSGALAADDLARATLAHIAREDAAVGAFACTLDADAAAAESLRLSGPLAGVPVAVKDIFDTRDLPTAYGSTLYAARPAACDAAVVSVLRHAGALVIGKSSTTEFAYLHPTATRNPRAPGRTPGGSSAGLGRRRGRRAGAAGRGHADRRLGDPAGVLLRRGGLQAQLRLAADGGAEVLPGRSTRWACSRATWPTWPCSRRP